MLLVFQLFFNAIKVFWKKNPRNIFFSKFFVISEGNSDVTPLNFDTMISIFLLLSLGDIRDLTSDSALSDIGVYQ